MKKFIVTAIGVGILGSAIIPFSEASRDAYHAYLMSQKDAKRVTYYRGRYGDTTRNKAETTTKSEGEKTYATYQGNARLYRNTRAIQQSYYVKATEKVDTDSQRKLRTFSTTTRAPWKTSKEKTKTVRTTNQRLPNFKFVTHNNDTFSLQLPVGYETGSNVSHQYTYDQDVEVRVEIFDKSVCEYSYGFTECAVKISKNENYEAIPGQGKITIVDTIIRQSKKNDTVLNNLGIQTSTYTEQFSAYFLNGDVYTVSRYLVQNQENGVYLVEVKIPQKVVSKYTGLDKKIFDSFRIYPEELVN